MGTSKSRQLRLCDMFAVRAQHTSTHTWRCEWREIHDEREKHTARLFQEVRNNCLLDVFNLIPRGAAL